MTSGVVLAIIAAVISGLVVKAILARAAQMGLVQKANDRSSHVEDTPAGGGVGFIVGILACGGWLALQAPQFVMPLALCTFIGLIGLLDDVRPVSVRWRLLAQLLAVGGVVVGLAAPILMGMAGQIIGALLVIAVILGGIWWVNLYNFLDGLDGYAASQGVFMSLCAALFSLGAGADASEPLLVMMLVTAGALIGFLIFNWPAAKIFMGDVGSTFLGLWLFCLMLMSVLTGWLNVWQWLLLAALFVVDASVTLAVRIARGEKPWEAHRNHGYQKLSRFFSGHHRPVVLLAIGVNIGFVLPTVYLAGLWPHLAPIITALTYLVLSVRAFSMGAGRPDQPQTS